MSSRANPIHTPQEYLAIEHATQQKNGYFDGEIFAMGGAGERRNLIVGNVFASLHAQARGKLIQVICGSRSAPQVCTLTLT
jgi:hypothetical protein